MPKAASARKVGEYLDCLLSKEGVHKLTSGEIAMETGAGNQVAKVCGIMYSRMKLGDEILNAPPSGTGTKLKIRYQRPVLDAEKTETVLKLIQWLRD